MSSKIKADFDENDNKSYKHLKAVDDSDEKLENFLKWCKQSAIEIDYNKVKITRNETSHNIGMIAITDIDQDVCIVKIPKNILLEYNNTEIKDLIKNNKNELNSESNWAKLVISLMYELNIDNSKWKPYLDLFPDYKYLDLPMFWEKSILEKYLQNTCVLKNVNTDLENMKNEFEKIVLPFVKKHEKYFNECCYNFEYYKNLVAFIMAYSFTDPNEDPKCDEFVGPKMVPVADILNHIAKNNAEIRFKAKELQICTNRFIKKNEEIYNTYGEHSNTDLLHMYGFTEKYPNNIFDNVEIPSKYFLEALNNLCLFNENILDKKFKLFTELDLIDDSASLIIGNDGVLNEEEILQVLQIYTMSSDELEEFCENEYEFEDESDEYSLTNDSLKKLPLDWKNLLIECCKLYKSVLINTQNNLSSTKQTRETHVRYLIEGHIHLINDFLKFFE